MRNKLHSLLFFQKPNNVLEFMLMTLSLYRTRKQKDSQRDPNIGIEDFLGPT